MFITTAMAELALRRIADQNRRATITAPRQMTAATEATATTATTTTTETVADTTRIAGKDTTNMEKIDFVFQDRWIKDTVRYWLNAVLPSNERAAIAYYLLEQIALHYAVLTYYDGNDLYVIGHANLDRCITISRNSDLHNWATEMYSMDNGGLYVKQTPVEVKSAIERAMGINREDADNRAAKKSCSLH